MSPASLQVDVAKRRRDVARLRALDNVNALIRMRAAMALGEIGPDAKPAYQRLLLHANQDTVPEVKAACAKAISRFQ